MMRKLLLLFIGSMVLVASWLASSGRATPASAAASALGNAGMAASSGTTTVSAAIAAYDDDLFQDGTTYTNDSGTVWLGDNRDPSASYAGLRFAGVAVPRGVAIQSASLRFFSIANNGLSFNVSIYGDACGNSAKFTGSSLPSGRPATVAKIGYANPPAWTASTWYAVDVTPVVAELTARTDWGSGNALSLIAKGQSGSSGMRRGIAGYSSKSSANVAQLVITYSAPGATATATAVAPSATRTSLPPTTTPTSTRAPTATSVPPTATPTTISPTPTPMLATTGPTYYVAPTGSDGNAGSQSSPWRTIAKAANTATAGATVYIMGGTYNAQLRPANAGTAGAWITFAAYPGQTVILDGSGLNLGNWSGLVDVSRRSYIKVSGLTLRNSSYAGLFADTTQHIVFQGNHTLHSQCSGIGIWNSVDVVADGNDIEDSNFNGGNEAVSVSGTAPFEIMNNKVHNPSATSTMTLKEGIDIKQGSHDGAIHHNEVYLFRRVSLYVDAFDLHTYNIQIYGNRVHDAVTGITLASESGGLLDNINVSNNIVWNITNAGIRTFGLVGTASHPMQNITYANNTVYGCGAGINVSNDQISNFKVVNNILSRNTINLELAAGVTGVFQSNNLFDGRLDYKSGSDLAGSPQFVNPAGADFHLGAGSLAIDHGTSNGAPAIDIDGVPRPQRAADDIGAYECR
ncbi:MAG TPA: right-handed parallel beta-helix repeat-containing protein [Anaerolineae bacterium]